MSSPTSNNTFYNYQNQRTDVSGNNILTGYNSISAGGGDLAYKFPTFLTGTFTTSGTVTSGENWTITSPIIFTGYNYIYTTISSIFGTSETGGYFSSCTTNLWGTYQSGSSNPDFYSLTTSGDYYGITQINATINQPYQFIVSTNFSNTNPNTCPTTLYYSIMILM
jgi:hypothetical protein